MSDTTSSFVRTIEVDSWSEFKTKVDSFMLEWIYRGQARADWKLSTTLERSSLAELDHDIEKTLICEYRRAVHSFRDLDYIPESTLEWLALLQHHGTPTRLMDFTQSPYVAAYFAFQEEVDVETTEPVAIWCVNKINFFQAAVYHLKKFIDLTDELGAPYTFSDQLFEEVFRQHDLNCVLPLDLGRSNQRHLAQQGTFLAVANPDLPFDKQLKFMNYQKDPAITKLLISRSERKTALRDLRKMNITHATLFPGIDGFARALNLEYTTLATLGEIGERIQSLERDGFAI